MSLKTRIIERVQADVAARRSRVPLSELKEMIESAPKCKSLLDALRKGFSIIGEIKEKSPSAGPMNLRNVNSAITIYNKSKIISAISVLTNPFFGGSIEDVRKYRKLTDKPIMRKEFIIDEYQVYEARGYGADAILLMASLHIDNPAQFSKLYELSKSIGLQPLVEIGMGRGKHSLGKQIAMIPTNVEMLGINSRIPENLYLAFLSKFCSQFFGSDLLIDKNRHKEIMKIIRENPKQIPKRAIIIAESGIHNPQEIKPLMDSGYTAALIGAAFLKGKKSIEDTVKEFSDYIYRLEHSPAYSVHPVFRKQFSH